MAGPQIAIEMTSEEAKLWQGFQKIIGGCGNLEAAMKKVLAAGKENTRETENWGAMAKRVFEQTRTPLEQYYRSYQNLNELLKRGKIDQETYNRALDQSYQAYRRAGEAGHQAFGEGLISKVTKLAISIAGIGTAVHIVKNAYGEMARSAEEAGQKALESEGGLGLLAQLAIAPGGKVDQAKFHRLVERGRQFYGAGATQSLNEAYNLVFQLESAGALGEGKIFEQLGASRLVTDPAMLARSARSLQAAMGAENVGSLKKVIGESFAVSAGTPITAEELLAATSRAATFGKMAGVSPKEVMAAVGVAAEASGGFSRSEMASAGATQIRALMASLSKIRSGQTGGEDLSQSIEQAFQEGGAEGEAADFTGWGGLQGFGKPGVPKLQLGGKDLIGMLEEIERAKLDPAQLLKLFGRKEAVAAYQSILAGRQKYREQVSLVTGVKGEEMLGRLTGLEETESVAAAARTRRVEVARGELSKEQIGAWTNVAEGLLQQRLRAGREAGEARILTALVEMGDRMVMKWAGPEQYVRWASQKAWGEPAVAADRLILEAREREQEVAEAEAELETEAAQRLKEAGDRLIEAADRWNARNPANPTMAGGDE